MYELPDSQTGGVHSAQFTASQTLVICDDEDRKSEAPKTLVMVLSVVLLFALVAVLAVLLIGSPGRDQNAKDNSDDGRGDDSTESGKIPDIIEVPLGPREPPSATTITTSERPRTVQTLPPTHPPGVQSCPVGGYYGKRIGRLATYAHAVSGFVYAASETSVVIKGLYYDGMDPQAIFWAEYKPSRVVAGQQLPDENGSYDYLKAYTNATVHLKLPENLTVFLSVGIHKELHYEAFGNVFIPSSYDLPKKQSLGQPRTRFGNVMANEVVLTDSSNMMLRGFFNDGQCPNAYFVAAPTALPHPEELTYLIYNGDRMDKLGIYNNTDVTIKLPAGCHWNQFKWFSVYCVDAFSSLTDIDIDTGAAERLPLHSPEPAVRR